MNRIAAVIAALALAPSALAQTQPEAQPAPAAKQEQPAADTSVDVAALQGKVEATEATLAEVKTAVDKLSKLKFSGYIQARYRWREDAWFGKDASTTPPKANTISQNGFFIRRGRFKATYDADWSQYALQIDATPSGVGLKEAYGTIKLPMGMAVDAGLQLFPFGYEVATRSSSDLDTLERAEISRRFLNGEYDLGVALKGKYQFVNWKVGLFNGNGFEGGKATGGVDNDGLRDLIGRVTADLGFVTAGVSGWWGKVNDYTKLTNGAPTEYDRQRLGADVQVYLDLLPVGGTALKGEYMWGKSTISDKNFGAGDTLGKTSSGWYALVTQNLGQWNQLAVRYEQFIKDHGVDRDLPASQGLAFKNAELQTALHTFLGENMKVTVAWFHPMIASHGDTATGANTDPKADSFIAQVQAKF